MKRLYFAKYGYMIMSVLFCLTGLAYMFLPDLSMFVLCIAGGLCLLAYGAIKLVGYLSPDLYCLAFQYDMASAILLMITGVLVIFCNTRLQGPERFSHESARPVSLYRVTYLFTCNECAPAYLKSVPFI